MREFKFRAWSPESNEMHNFDMEKASNDQYIAGHVCALLANKHPNGKDLMMQFTGLTDKSGVDIYDGDIINICFTSDSGVFVHDGVYVVSSSAIGGLEFDFKRLLWVSFGYNQYPKSMTLNEKYGGLSTVYGNGKINLIANDQYSSKIEASNVYPFNHEKELSFCSRYFEVIGNIYQNPELIENNNK